MDLPGVDTQCREDVEGQFFECWNCGSERPQGSAV